jgi:protein O-GlcNAc transferase
MTENVILQNLFIEAIQNHQQEKLKDAKYLYLKILETNPYHPDANHNLAIIVTNDEENELALKFINNAIEINNELEQYWITYIAVLKKLCELEHKKEVIDIASRNGMKDKNIELLLLRLSKISKNNNIKEIEINKENKIQYKDNVKKLLKELEISFSKSNFKLVYDLAIKIIEIDNKNIKAWTGLGAALSSIGKYVESIECFKKCVEITPKNFESYYNLANAFKINKQNEEALNNYKESLKLNNKSINTHMNLANLYLDLGCIENGIKHSKEAIKLNKNNAIAHSNYANALNLNNQHKDAIYECNLAIKLQPNLAVAFANRGNANFGLGNFENAENDYIKSLKIENNAYFYGYYGALLRYLGRNNEALGQYLNAYNLKPEISDLCINIGYIYRDLNDISNAEKYLIKALTLNNTNTKAYIGLATIYDLIGKSSKALDCLAKACEIESESIYNHWYFTLSQIPSVYSSELNSIEQEKLLKNNLLIIKERINKLDKKEIVNLNNLIGVKQLYYLAYNENNNKDIISKYGDICCKIMNEWQLEKKLHFSNKNKNELIRIGIVSDHIRYHSVWNAFLNGIITNLDKTKFEIYIYSLNLKQDKETLKAINNSAKFIKGPKLLEQWAREIVGDCIDILFYPEIGMNAMTFRLATMRLAAKQITSWGHPETSGLPTIDYYISADLLETSNSEYYYSEKLIKLPNIGSYYYPISVEYNYNNLINIKNNLRELNILCLGVPNKFNPKYDYIYFEIIKNNANANFIFLKDQNNKHEALMVRFNNLADSYNIKLQNNFTFIDSNLSRQDFSALMKNSTLLLDTIGFSGFNTAMQAVACGLPIVTLPNHFMRSRNASAILRLLDCTELIAINEVNYIEIVNKLIKNNYFHQEIIIKMKKNEKNLYLDENVIKTLELEIEKIYEI